MTLRAELDDPHVLGVQEAAALLAEAPWTRLVTIGDSIAEGVREPVPGYRDLSWVDRTEEALRHVRPQLLARNLGRRGLVAERIRGTQLAPALEFGPDLAIVVAGGNDMLAPRFDADGVRRELTALISAFRAIGADVATIGLFDITQAGRGDPRFRDTISLRTHRLNALTAAVAAELGACHVVSAGHPAALDPGIYSSDDLHLNARGHAVVAANTIRALADHLARNDPPGERPGRSGSLGVRVAGDRGDLHREDHRGWAEDRTP